MNDSFDSRWKLAARTAREERPEAAPFGFAARTVAQWLAAPEPSASGLWQTLALRVLGGVAALLAVSIAVAFWPAPERDPLAPAIADTVSDTFWIL